MPHSHLCAHTPAIGPAILPVSISFRSASRFARAALGALSLLATLSFGSGAARAATQTKIFFVSDRAPGAGIYVSDADGAGATRLVADAREPALSRDGTKLAYALNDDIFITQVTVVNGVVALTALNGTVGSTPLTTDGTAMREAFPSFSPDGSELIFERGALGATDLVLIKSDGSEPGVGRPAFTRNGNDISPRFVSATRIVFARSGDLTPATNSNRSLVSFTLGAASNTLTVEQDGSGNASASIDRLGVSPLNNEVVYSRPSAPTRGLYRKTLGATGSPAIGTSVPGDNFPTFSPDGTKIVFSSTVASRGATSSMGEVFVMNADGSGAVNVTNNTANDLTPVIGEITVAGAGTPDPTGAAGLVVTTTADTVTRDGLISLREAIDNSASNGDESVITFNVSGEILLTSGLTLSQPTTIIGPAAGIIISEAGNNRQLNIFRVNNRASALVNLTIRNGATGVLNESSVSISNCTLSGHHMAVISAGNLNMTGSTVIGSTNEGIQNTSGTSTITNSTFTGNLSGLLNLSGTSMVLNCTMSGNGSGVETTNSGVTIKNSLIVGNSFMNLVLFDNQLAAGSGGNITDGTAAESGLDTVLRNNGGTTPTFALLPGSRAIDAGINSNIPSGVTTDQRGNGFARIVNAIVDVGALEFVPAATTGVIISEFRFRGKSGALDEYVELYNKRGGPLNISGWSLQTRTASGLQTISVPTVTTIPAFGRYLFTGSGFSLSAYGTSNQSLGADVVNNSGVALFNAAGAVQDAVGFTNSDAALKEGAGLPSAPTSDGEYAFVRDTTGTLPKDTADSTNDFVFVIADATTPAALATVTGTGGNVVGRLGAPSPEGTSNSVYVNPFVTNALLDPNAAQSAAPNRERVGFVPGTSLGDLLIRRTITNQSGRPLTKLRFSVAIITSLGTPGPSTQADVRVVSSSDESVTIGGVPMAVKGLTLESGAAGQPSLPLGGGLGSSAALGEVSMATPLAPGASRNVVFRLQIRKSGNFSVQFNFHAVPGS